MVALAALNAVLYLAYVDSLPPLLVRRSQPVPGESGPFAVKTGVYPEPPKVHPGAVVFVKPSLIVTTWAPACGVNTTAAAERIKQSARYLGAKTLTRNKGKDSFIAKLLRKAPI